MRRAVIALAALAGLAALFLWTATRTVAEPYTVRAASLTGWSVAVEAQDPLGALVTLRPAPDLPMQVSRQIFRRHTESMLSPAVHAMPLVLRREYDEAIAGVLSPDDLAAMAVEARVADHLVPDCLAAARRADGSPGRIFFLRFDSAAFQRFRDAVAAALPAGGAQAFDPQALSPLLVISASDRTFESWVPRRAGDDACVAPVAIETA